MEMTLFFFEVMMENGKSIVLSRPAVSMEAAQKRLETDLKRELDEKLIINFYCTDKMR